MKYMSHKRVINETIKKDQKWDISKIKFCPLKNGIGK